MVGYLEDRAGHPDLPETTNRPSEWNLHVASQKRAISHIKAVDRGKETPWVGLGFCW